MNEQEAREAVERTRHGYSLVARDEGLVSPFTLALDAYRSAILAGMPCLREAPVADAEAATIGIVSACRSMIDDPYNSYCETCRARAR